MTNNTKEIEMNQVQIINQQKEEAQLNLNGFLCHVGKLSTGKWLEKTFSEQRWFTVQVCHPWNMSNRILVQAATVKTLAKKLENMEELWPFSATGNRIKI